MQFGSNPELGPMDRVDQSFETLKFVANILERQNNQLHKVLPDSFKTIIEQPKYYIAHEYFEDFNQPLYFREFVSQIEKYGLAYLTDSSTPRLYHNVYFKDDEYEKVCHYFNFRLEAIEQFIDFIANRNFRRSIITHKQNLEEKGIVNNVQQYELCHNFYDVYFKAHIEYIPATEEKEAYWNVADGRINFTDTPLHKIVFSYLQQQRDPCRVNDIFEYVKAYSEYDEIGLQALIWSIIHADNVYLCFAPEKASTYDKKPKLFEAYRKFIDLVRHNPEITNLSNRFYQVINLDFLSQYIAQYLDGTRSIKALIKQIRQDIDDEAIVIRDAQENKLSNKDVKEKEIKDLIIERLELFKEYGYFTEY